MAKAVTWTGAAEFDRKLKRLAGSVSKRAAAQAVNAAMNPIVRGIKDEIDGTTINTKHPNDLKHAARQTIGKRLTRERGAVSPIPTAKAGFGVGSGRKKKLASQAAKRGKRIASLRKRGKRSGGGGVGIDARNIVWAVLGNENDRTQAKTGRNTGKMPAVFKNVIPKAIRSSARAAFSVAKTKLRQVLLKEALKKG